MGDILIPGGGQEEAGDKDAASGRPSAKCANDSRKQLSHGEGNFGKKAKVVIAIVGVTEIFSLILWQVADIVHGYLTGFVHWLSVCGFLAGAGYLSNRALKRSMLVWISYAAICLLVAPLFILSSLRVRSLIRAQQADENKIARWQPPELPPNCSNVFVSFGGQRITVPVWAANISAETSGTKFLLKDAPPELTNGYDKLPGFTRTSSNIFLRWESMQTTVGGKTVNYPIIPHIKNNRLFVYVETPFKNEKRIISMSNDLDSEIPQTWDRNYSSNAFEVVNEDGRPILQVFYKRSNEIQVNGVFIVNNYDVYESFGALPLLISPRVRIAGNQTTQELEIEDFKKMFPKVVASVDTNAVYAIKFTDQKPMFKYPAWKHLGEYSN
jgi:hypothetical protein